jgi:hypothetical protein
MLEIRVLEPPDQAALEAFLLPHVASSMMPSAQVVAVLEALAITPAPIDARAAGAETSMLFTGDDNLSAQRVYRALGSETDRRISRRVDLSPEPSALPPFL